MGKRSGKIGVYGEQKEAGSGSPYTFLKQRVALCGVVCISKTLTLLETTAVLHRVSLGIVFQINHLI